MADRYSSALGRRTGGRGTTRAAAALLCVGLVMPAAAAATTQPAEIIESAPSTGPATATASATIFALVVGNNRSLSLSQPDLHYADDDAIKFGQLFLALGGQGRVHVLTSLDEPTALLFDGQIQPRAAPTGEAIKAAAATLRDQVAQARAAGAQTTLYFVFAGHGEEERGRGYLELEDGRFYREDLVELIESISPDRAHLLLDSCNSFFVIHPRRPGGRAWTTSTEIADHLEVPGIDVGVFLSTSAEAQVYEWSQLQSGVFSHAVRSALTGAADADLDRRITYRELDAFVTTAASGIQNALYRPQLYARTPRETDVFLDLRGTRETFALRGFSSRVTLRDQRGVRLADVNPEPGFEPLLLRWPDLELTVIAEEQGDDGRAQLYETQLGDALVVSPPLAMAGGAARGSQALFAQYFRVPYGPGALAAQEALAQLAPPQVFGLTSQQESRFAMQLRLMSDESHKQHIMSAMTGILIGAGGASLVGIPLLVAADQMPVEIEGDTAIDEEDVRSVVRLAGSAAALPFIGLAVISALNLIGDSSGSKIWADFKARPASSEAERSIRVASAADALAVQAKQNKEQRQLRMIGYGISGVLLCIVGGGAISSLEDGGQDLSSSLVLGAVSVVALSSGLILTGAAVSEGLNPSPEETFLEVMRRDPESVLRAE